MEVNNSNVNIQYLESSIQGETTYLQQPGNFQSDDTIQPHHDANPSETQKSAPQKCCFVSVVESFISLLVTILTFGSVRLFQKTSEPDNKPNNSTENTSENSENNPLELKNESSNENENQSGNIDTDEPLNSLFLQNPEANLPLPQPLPLEIVSSPKPMNSIQPTTPKSTGKNGKTIASPAIASPTNKSIADDLAISKLAAMISNRQPDEQDSIIKALLLVQKPEINQHADKLVEQLREDQGFEMSDSIDTTVCVLALIKMLSSRSTAIISNEPKKHYKDLADAGSREDISIGELKTALKNMSEAKLETIRQCALLFVCPENFTMKAREKDVVSTLSKNEIENRIAIQLGKALIGEKKVQQGLPKANANVYNSIKAIIANRETLFG